MKTVLFVRHAQSGWNAASGDFERPLDDKGKQDVLILTQRLVNRSIPVDALFSSPARRARKTADAFIKAYGLPQNQFQLKEELYQPSDESFMSVIEQISDDWSHPAIFSHNPGITHFVNLLCDEVHIDDMPTCGIFAIKTGITRWQDFREAPKQFWFFESPRTISGSYSSFI